MRSRGEIILTMDSVYNVPMLNINFDDWYVNSVRLWPKSDKARHCFQCWFKKTLPDTPSSNISCCSNSASIDTYSSLKRNGRRNFDVPLLCGII